jgi:aspartokinase-like uncharacterized kinase
LAPAKEKLLNSKEILGISQVGGKKNRRKKKLISEVNAKEVHSPKLNPQECSNMLLNAREMDKKPSKKTLFSES